MEKKATIKYYLSEAGRKAAILAGGDGKQKQIITTDVTPEILSLANVDVNGDVTLEVARKISIRQNEPQGRIVGTTSYLSYRTDEFTDSWYEEGKPRITLNENYSEILDERKFFDELQTVETILAFIRENNKQIKELEVHFKVIIESEKVRLQPELTAAIKEWQVAVAYHKELVARKAIREEEAQTAKDAILKERAAWIQEHGSDYLKKAVALGYNSQRHYVNERSTFELPGYVVDFDDKATWENRSAPSIEALEEEEKLRAAGYSQVKIVWLEHPPYKFVDDEDDEEWEKCEAVVVSKYLNKYDLIKVI